VPIIFLGAKKHQARGEEVVIRNGPTNEWRKKKEEIKPTVYKKRPVIRHLWSHPLPKLLPKNDVFRKGKGGDGLKKKTKTTR